MKNDLSVSYNSYPELCRRVIRLINSFLCFLLFFPLIGKSQHHGKHNFLEVKLNQCMVPSLEKNATDVNQFISDTAIFINSVPMNSTWKIDFYAAFGYKQIVGQEPDNYAVFARGNKMCSFTFKEIIEKMEIEEVQYLKPQTNLAPIHNNRFTRGWYFFKKGDQLVMRAVSSYPNGNMTSWFHEATYVFLPSN